MRNLIFWNPPAFGPTNPTPLHLLSDPTITHHQKCPVFLLILAVGDEYDCCGICISVYAHTRALSLQHATNLLPRINALYITNISPASIHLAHAVAHIARVKLRYLQCKGMPCSRLHRGCVSCTWPSSRPGCHWPLWCRARMRDATPPSPVAPISTSVLLVAAARR